MDGRVSVREWYYALMDYGTHLKKTIGNVSRRSASYAKPSPFKGSRREVRGKVLKVLTKEKRISVRAFSKRIAISHNLFNDVIGELIREGFVTKKGKELSLA
jgi:A/G-specific adenine glycosylase